MSTMAIWERGIWLAEAPYHFAPNTLRVKYDAPEVAVPFSETSGIRMVVAQLKEPDKRQKFLSLMRQLHEWTGKSSAQSAAYLKMIDRLLRSLQSRKLIAYGIRIPRTTNSEPEQIPLDLFRPRFIKWTDSSIRGAGAEFQSVRVLRPNQIKAANAQSAQLPKPEPPTPKKRPPGRPSSKDAITVAIQLLIADGKLPNSKTRKENITLVRARVHELVPALFPGDTGLKEETIGKYLAIAFPRP